jgi:signal transduction histidine kinase
MEPDLMAIELAATERASVEELQNQNRGFSEVPLLSQFLEAIPEAVLVLNRTRQIVLANRGLANLLGTEAEDSVRGLRFGEALACVHSDETAGGCGTTEFCRECGATKAIDSCQQGAADVQECRILRRPGGEALDLRVWATPLEVNDEEFTIFAVSDIGHEKRRRALERVFFHDILNTAGGLRGFVELLGEVEPEEVGELQGVLNGATGLLIEEINSHKQLAAAESNDLIPEPSQIGSAEFLQAIARSYARQEVARDRSIKVESGESTVFTSDRALLGRVLGNMVKNALEASGASQTVTLGYRTRGERIEFWVHNLTCMAPAARLQVFQRSYSTKGPGRGLGTYSMKLLSERYLGGTVSCTTSAELGTTFTASYPLALAPAETE